MKPPKPKPMSERAAVIAKLRRIYTPKELQSLRDRIFYPGHVSKSRVLKAAARLLEDAARIKEESEHA